MLVYGFIKRCKTFLTVTPVVKLVSKTRRLRKKFLKKKNRTPLLWWLDNINSLKCPIEDDCNKKNRTPLQSCNVLPTTIMEFFTL